MERTPHDPAGYRAQVAAFAEIRPICSAFKAAMADIFARCIRELGLLAIVEARAKTVPSFAEKALRKPLPDPVNGFTDLCGVRVITDTQSAIEPVCRWIRKRFDVDDHHSEDAIERLSAGEFGYRSVHFIVSIRPGTFDDIIQAHLRTKQDGAGRAAEAYLRRFFHDTTESDAAALGVAPGVRFRAEVQVRTLLAHTWATFYHDRIYKGEFKIPRAYEREARRIAATLEEADAAFGRTIDAIERYRTSYGAYLSTEQRKQEMRTVDTVLSVLHDAESEPERRRLAIRRARIALSLGDPQEAERSLALLVQQWEASPAASVLHAAIERLVQAGRAPDAERADRTEQALADLEDLRDPGTAVLLRDFGRTLAEQGRVVDAQSYLRLASRLDPADSEAWVTLGSTLEARDSKEAIAAYDAALRLDSIDPYALAALLRCKALRERSMDVARPLRHSIEAAVARCRERAHAGVYLPYAYYDIGVFESFLGATAPEDASPKHFLASLTAYAKGVQLSDSADPIDRALDVVSALQRELERPPKELVWIRLFLLAARPAKLFRVRRGLVGKAHSAEAALEKARQNSGNAEERGKAEEALTIAQRDRSRVDARLREAREACQREARYREIARLPRPFVLAAGGCNHQSAQKVGEYRAILERAFDGFSGTIVSGGTTSGLCGIAGDLPISDPPRGRRLAYRPRYLPTWVEWHPGYEPIESASHRFSPLETIQTWVDLMTLDDLDPGDVRLIGINGGAFSAWEYRLALAMGAKAGIFVRSGRAATDIFADEEWHDSPGLLQLPDDAPTLRTLVSSPPVAPLEPADREALAREAHETYRKRRAQALSGMDPALLPWEQLPENLKRSNRLQIDHLAEKLRTIGFTMRKTAPGADIADVVPPQPQIDIMAELEHGRWNAERLLDEWKPGPRDHAKKTSPYIVRWAELPEEIKEYDRDAVRGIPALLKAKGYEVVEANLGSADEPDESAPPAVPP